MRLFPQQIDAIKQHTRDIFGPQAVVQLFRSRLGDAARGGDVALHFDCGVSLELNALAFIRLGAKCSRAMLGRRICDSQIGLSIM